jgi:hypothetical protein
MRQKDQLELSLSSEARGEAPSVVARAIEARAAKACLERPAVSGPSMEAVVEGENLKQALAQVNIGLTVPGATQFPALPFYASGGCKAGGAAPA